MDEVYGSTDPFAKCFWPEVIPSDTHAVLYQLPLSHNGQPPKPHQSRGTWKWDQTHVRLPCSPESQYPVRKSDGTSEVVNRWELIETALLSRPITNSKELELAIFSYNSKYSKSWNFQGLHTFFENELDEPESDLFFSSILPKIIELALQLPTLVPSSIPLLKSGHNMSLSMTQQQIACLMANAFLCTFPRRNTQKMNSEYKHFPDVNFNRLYYSTQSNVMEKLKCICHYFRRVTTDTPIGVVTFRRRSLPPKCIPKFPESTAEMSNCKLLVRSSGTIESDGKGLLQVDFANKMIGGGVLGQGCVQEEIRFMICPELLITRLFTEVLRPEEALFIIGAEQFSLYSGYASSFEWAGNCNDTTPLDGNQRKQCQIVAIDALPFRDPKHQYRTELMHRELTKAYVGYGRLQQQMRVAPGVASGNWGCGAFMGDAHLKSLLQMMVCAIAERPLVYFTFGDQRLVKELEDMYAFLCEKKVTVGQMWKVLEKFGPENKNSDGDELFDYIRKKVENKGGFRLGGCVGGGRAANMAALFSFNPKSRPKLTAPKKGDLQTAIFPSDANYNNTTDEEEEDMSMQERKKKLTSPEGGGREKQPRMSLADCLDTYYTKDNGRRDEMQAGTSRDGMSSMTAEVEEIRMSEEVEPEVELSNGSLDSEEKGNSESTVEEEEEPRMEVEPTKFDVIVQIDEEGGEYIDSTPPPKDAQYMGKQTKLMDFFKMKNIKK